MKKSAITVRVVTGGFRIGDGSTTTEVYDETRDAERHSRQGRRAVSPISMTGATMITLDEMWLPCPRQEANTVNQLAIFWDEELEDLTEAPAICIVWPRRQTFRFSAEHPLTVLPARRPFFPVSTEDNFELDE